MWRRTKPGMVRVHQRDYIATLQRALRARELEDEGRALRDRNSALARERRAREVVAEQAAGAEVRFSALDVDGLLGDLPMTPDGTLHEAAFTALLDQVIWQRRLARLDA